MTRQTIRVLTTRDEDSASLAAFFHASWNADATAESVLAARRLAAQHNVAEPGAPVPTAIALAGERVIGYVSSIPMRTWASGRDWPAYWVKGLMVVPEHRNGPIGFLVLKELLKTLPRSGVLLVAPPARKLLGALGYHDMGVLPNYMRVLRGGHVAARLDASLIGGVPPWAAKGVTILQRSGLARAVGALGASALGAYASSARGAGGYHVDLGPMSSAAIDELWARVRDGIGAASVRDGTTLTARYGLGADTPVDYVAASIWRRDNIAGLVIVRRPRESGDPRLKGIRVAVLSDLLVPSDARGAIVAAVRAAELVARSLDADALLCTTPNRSLAQVLNRLAYAAIGGNLHFLWRETADSRARVPDRLDEWWIMRGDGESDAVF